MLIVVNTIYQSMKPYSLTVFNTDNGKFSEAGLNSVPAEEWHNLVPKVDGYTMTIFDTSEIRYILLGKYNGSYVVTNGGREIRIVSAEKIRNSKPVNWYIDENNKIQMFGAQTADLSFLFENDTFVFTEDAEDLSGSSAGQQEKFYGYLKSNPEINGLIKFPIMTGSKDIEYEVLYKTAGDTLGVPVVRAYTGIYTGRPCVLSVFEYDEEFDSFKTFYKCMIQENTTLSGILNRVNNPDVFTRYLILDYLFAQEDRHYRNLAVCNNSVYPLFDNGRCLGTGAVTSISAGNHVAVERNIKNWYCSDENVRKMIHEFENLKTVMLPQYENEYRMLERNYEKLRRVINA